MSVPVSMRVIQKRRSKRLASIYRDCIKYGLVDQNKSRPQLLSLLPPPPRLLVVSSDLATRQIGDLLHCASQPLSNNSPIFL